MHPHHQTILTKFHLLQRDGDNTRPEHAELGIDRICYGLRNPERREIMLTWIKDHKDISYDEWLALCDSLYHGESYEERCAPQTLLDKFPKFRRQLPLSQLDAWLGQLDGWAEVDTTCQSIFTYKDLLSDWDSWREFLEKLSQDDNTNKRRASLVLLVRPVSKSDDDRLLQQMFATVERLKHESDKRITKAISWVLRAASRQHHAAIDTYITDHVDSLPAIAVRETRKKLDTGKK